MIHIIGGGGHAKVVVDALQKSHRPLSRIFDLAPKEGKIGGFLVEPLPPLSWWEAAPRSAIVALGDNRLRQEISQKYASVAWVNAIHPSAIIHETACLGRGIYVGPGVIIQPDVHIKDHCIINTGAILEHDCLIHDYCHVGPRSTLTGGVEIGEGSLIGAGTTIIPQQSVGDWCLIGAGSTVVQSIPPHSTAWGVPCRVKGKISPKTDTAG